MKVKFSLRQRRVFSEALKKKAALDIESGKVSVLAVAREYEVTTVNVYRWLKKYSRHLQTSKTMVVQMDSEAYKAKELEKKIRELEAAVGRKQLEIDFLNKLIDQGKEELGVDLKKKFSTPPFSGSGSTNGNTDIK
ncbi:MAG TPA: transposase [Chitinophagaceae bacterium]